MAGPLAAGDAGGSTQHTLDQAETGFTWTRTEQLAALKKLREPFPATAISKKPQVWCRPCLDAPTKHCKNHQKTKCSGCGQNVTTAHTDLDYVGHAEATARLLDVDPLWSWEPVAYTEQGLPLLDQFGGMWMRLTVCGMTRIGYGDAYGKKAGTHAVKEIIGDGIRNAGMRFGMALDLWSKTDIQVEQEEAPQLKILGRLREAKVWTAPRGLQAMLEQAVEEEVADLVLEEAEWQTLREVIEGRLEELARIAEEREAQAQRRAEEAPQAAAQVAAEHGAAPVAPSAPQQDAAPAPQGPSRQQELVALGQKVNNAWYHLGGTEQNLREAEAKGLTAEKVPGPDGRMYEVGELLAARIAELRQQQQQGQPTGTYAAAGITGNQQSRQEVA